MKLVLFCALLLCYFRADAQNNATFSRSTQVRLDIGVGGQDLPNMNAVLTDEGLSPIGKFRLGGFLAVARRWNRFTAEINGGALHYSASQSEANQRLTQAQVWLNTAYKIVDVNRLGHLMPFVGVGATEQYLSIEQAVPAGTVGSYFNNNRNATRLSQAAGMWQLGLAFDLVDYRKQVDELASIRVGYRFSFQGDNWMPTLGDLPSDAVSEKTGQWFLTVGIGISSQNNGRAKPAL